MRRFGPDLHLPGRRHHELSRILSLLLPRNTEWLAPGTRPDRLRREGGAHDREHTPRQGHAPATESHAAQAVGGTPLCFGDDGKLVLDLDAIERTLLVPRARILEVFAPHRWPACEEHEMRDGKVSLALWTSTGRADLLQAQADEGGMPAIGNSELRFRFRRNATGTWEFRFRGHSYPPMKELKGYRYIQHLLQNAGRAIPALALSRLVEHPGSGPQETMLAEEALDAGLSIALSSDAGPVSDNRSRQEYGQRLAVLREQLEDMRMLGDAEQAAQIEDKMDSIARALNRGTGLRGQDVPAASTRKRAQQAVSAAIRGAIDTLVQHCEELGHHLRQSIKTGYHFEYRPDPRIRWHY